VKKVVLDMMCSGSKDYNVIWLSNLLLLSVYDECYFRQVSCSLNLISIIFVGYGHGKR